VKASGLKSSTNDYYNGAYLWNLYDGVTTPAYWKISDFTGSTKEITISAADVNMAANDMIFITNIQGNNRIDAVSFDLVGNTDSGKRNGEGNNWKFARSINQFESASSLINKLLYESHCILFQSYNQYKLVALDSATSADTWTKPLKTEGREFFDIKQTPLGNVFTNFKLNYHYDYGKGEYTREFYVDKNGYTSGGTVISATEKTLCESAETNYRIKNNFEYSSDWIYDLTTAELFLQKLVKWFTKQRMIVTWTTGLHDSSFDYIKSELGDQKVLTNTRILPTGISGVKCFMIMSKQIAMLPGAPYITWQLMEMEDLPV